MHARILRVKNRESMSRMAQKNWFISFGDGMIYRAFQRKDSI